MQFSSHLWYNKTMDCKRKSFVNSAPKRRNTVVSRNIGNLYPPPDKILTADYFLSGQLQAADIILLHLQRGMDIAVQSDASIRMTEQFAQSFWIKAIFHANRCISVTEHVEIHPPDTTGFQNPLKSILHCPRSVGLVVPVTRYAAGFPLNFASNPIRNSGIGMVRTEVRLFGVPMMTSDVPPRFTRCTVRLTESKPFSRSMSSQRRAASRRWQSPPNSPDGEKVGTNYQTYVLYIYNI